jgi:hypothetical protein
MSSQAVAAGGTIGTEEIQTMWSRRAAATATCSAAA